MAEAMRGVYTSLTKIRRTVFREVARIAYEDTDGVYDEFADFLSDVGIPIEETDVPVDFLAGTAHGILSCDGE